MSTNAFYVYVIFRANGLPCYVGKGKGRRWLQHFGFGSRHSNKRLGRIIAAAGGKLPVVKVREGLVEADAMATEIALIAAIGRENAGTGPLVNLTDGGDGQSGWIPSAETRAKIGKGNAGKKRTAEVRASMSAARLGKTKTEEHRRKIGAANAGAKASEAAKEKMRISSRLRWAKSESHDALKVYHASMTPERRAARGALISAATKAAMADPEIRAKIGAARRASA